MRRPTFVSCIFVLFAATWVQPAQAHPPGYRDYTGYEGSYSLRVEDESGQTLRSFEKGGEHFVLGNHGQRYAILLRNNTGRRVEAVVTVDGRDVVNGRVGDFVHGRGYVLAPYATLRIEGFRKNLAEVAAFRFSSPEASYSSRMGTPENVGVIGAAFFPERVYPPRPRMAQPEAESKRGSAAPSSSAPRSAAREADRDADSLGSLEAAPGVNNLGTEYGESRDSQVEEVRFERASYGNPALVTVLRYDNRAGLLARGIELEPRHVSYREPRAFPRNRFAPPPP